MKLRLLFATTLFTLVFFAPPSWAQMKVRINWTALTGAQSGLFVAYEDITRRVVRSYAEAVYVFKSNKAAGIKAIQKYARVKEGFLKKLWGK